LHYLDSCDFKSKPDCSVALNLFILRLDWCISRPPPVSLLLSNDVTQLCLFLFLYETGAKKKLAGRELCLKLSFLLNTLSLKNIALCIERHQKSKYNKYYVQSRAINVGRQGHSLTQLKMLNCKTVVNVITYHHVVWH
jgi:hypothetical protein